MKTKRLEINDGQGLPYAIAECDMAKPRSKRWSVTLWSGCISDRCPKMAVRRTTKRHVRDVLRRALKQIPILDSIAA